MPGFLGLWFSRFLIFPICSRTHVDSLFFNHNVRKCVLFALGVWIERDIMWQLFFVRVFFWRVDFLSLNFILRGLHLSEYLDNLSRADLKFSNILLKSCF